MSSEVEICNLALSHLGDSATVASIDPPEGSSQAEHCARWYPIARNSLLEMGEWNFAITRAPLASLVSSVPGQYSYARPSDCLKLLDIWPVDGFAGVYELQSPVFRWISQSMRGFTTEIDANGNQIILTGQANAVARYTKAITDTSKFSPLFTDTLARYLASYLAGPVLKGTTGIQVGQAQMQIARALMSAAALSSASQSNRQQMQSFPWNR